MEKLNDYEASSRVAIHKALALATGGHFNQAMAILDGIDASCLSDTLREEYYSACEWAYGVWAEYSAGSSFAPVYKARSMAYLDSLIEITDTSEVVYKYRLAERRLRDHDYQEAIRYYHEAIDSLPVNCRLYAQSAYALALAMKGRNDTDGYRHWLIRAAISDQVTPLKENLALQQLSLDLKDLGELQDANEYLNFALEDAIFYNNRLRMVEIAEKIPEIAIAHLDEIERQNRSLKLFLLIICVLFATVGASVVYIRKQNSRLTRSRNLLRELNRNQSELNRRLEATNRWREQYVSLFINLCAAYIDKLHRFRSTVALKIKARQFDDLLRVAEGNARPAEAEMKELFFNFDKAFLRLYPDFVE